MDHTELVQRLLRQQGAIAEFGTFAFRQTDLALVLNEAARVCAKAFDVPFSKVCRYRPAEDDLIIEAGHGWSEGVIGFVVGHPDARTPQGRAFSTGDPAVCRDLADDIEFDLPPFYAEHGIVSTVDVVIKGEDTPYGVLEIDSSTKKDYDEHDIEFLTSFANILSEAVATAERIKVLGSTIDRMSILVADQDRLLDQKRVLAEELQHRVRNNLQLVHGMLSKQLDEADATATKRGLKGIARRVFTLAQVYDQLLGSEMTRRMDFCSYVKSLCDNLAEVQGPLDGSIEVRCTCSRVMLDLDVITSLGIIVAELVTNSIEHAFPTGGGQVLVSLHSNADNGTATLTVLDDGTGFTPSTESKRHGLGLVRRLIEQVGGSVTLKADNGTVWTFEFPLEATADVELSRAHNT